RWRTREQAQKTGEGPVFADRPNPCGSLSATLSASAGAVLRKPLLDRIERRAEGGSRPDERIGHIIVRRVPAGLRAVIQVPDEGQAHEAPFLHVIERLHSEFGLLFQRVIEREFKALRIAVKVF